MTGLGSCRRDGGGNDGYNERARALQTPCQLHSALRENNSDKMKKPLATAAPIGHGDMVGATPHPDAKRPRSP